MYKTSDLEVLDIVEQAVQFGVKSWGKQEAMALQIASFWLEGWIAGMQAKDLVTEDDIKSIRLTIKNYYFF